MGEPDYAVAIIGAGPGGIAAAKLLRDKPVRRPQPAPHAEEPSA